MKKFLCGLGALALGVFLSIPSHGKIAERLITQTESRPYYLLDTSGVLILGPSTTSNGVVDLSTSTTPNGLPATFFDIAPSAAAKSQVRLEQGTSVTSPVEGDVWNDSTQKTLVQYVNAIQNRLVGCIYTSTGGVAIANTVSESTFTTSQTGYGTITLPANFFTTGKTLRLKIEGFYGVAVSTTANFQVRLGTTSVASSGAVAFSTGTIGSPAGYFDLEALVTAAATGGFGTGSVISQGRFLAGVQSSTQTTIIPVRSGATTSIDTTVSNAINTTLTWGTATTSNTMTPTNIIYEVLN